jgi:glutaredoxin
MKFPIALFLLALAGTVLAQSTYRWVDKEGKVHYTDHPPAAGEAAKVEQKRSVLLGVDQTMSYTLRQAMADYPVTLYTQKDCPPCVDGRNHLNKRGVPFTEKNVGSDAEIASLKSAVGGEQPGLPVLQVGRKASKQGYLASEWDVLLDSAGYPKAAGR